MLSEDRRAWNTHTAVSYRILQRFPNAEEVHTDPDLVLWDVFSLENLYPRLMDENRNAKFLLLSGENIFRTKRIYSRPLSAYIKNMMTWNFSPDAYPGCAEYIQNNSGREFAILSNTVPGADHIFSLPLWMQYGTSDSVIKLKQDNQYRDKKGFCVLIANGLTPERTTFLRKLSRYKKIDRYFHSWQDSLKDLSKLQAGNIASRFGIGWNSPTHPEMQSVRSSYDTWKIYKDYKFVLSFENSVADDYITEKIYQAMLGNSIPLYYGSSNIGEYFNTDSFINYNDFQSFDAMVEKVIELDRDEDKYQALLAQPFFSENRLPDKVANWSEDLMAFVDRVLDH